MAQFHSIKTHRGGIIMFSAIASVAVSTPGALGVITGDNAWICVSPSLKFGGRFSKRTLEEFQKDLVWLLSDHYETGGQSYIEDVSDPGVYRTLDLDTLAYRLRVRNCMRDKMRLHVSFRDDVYKVAHAVATDEGGHYIHDRLLTTLDMSLLAERVANEFIADMRDVGETVKTHWTHLARAGRLMKYDMAHDSSVRSPHADLAAETVKAAVDKQNTALEQKAEKRIREIIRDELKKVFRYVAGED